MSGRRWDQGVITPTELMCLGAAAFLFGLGWALRPKQASR